jgi:hypothetical protein
MAIVGLARRSKLVCARPESQPGVAVADFYRWRSRAIASGDWFAWTVLGIGLGLPLLSGAFLGIFLGSNAWKVLIQYALIHRGLWLIGLLVSAVYGSQAAKLKKQSGIVWPL